MMLYFIQDTRHYFWQYTDLLLIDERLILMMKNWKRLLSMLMAASLLTSSVGGVGFAEGEPVIVAEETALPAENLPEAPAENDGRTEVEAPQLPAAGEARVVEEIAICLSQASVSLTEGESVTLTAEVTGASAADIVWSSSDECVTVDGGVITAVSAGTAKITAAIGDAKAECTVRVSAKLKGFVLNVPLPQIQPGAQFEVYAAADPAGAEFDSVEWSCDDPAVATVQQSGTDKAAGVITAHAPGKTMLRVRCGEVSGAFELVVQHLPLTEMTMSQAAATIHVGGQMTLSVTPNEYAQLGEVVWSSESDAIATVKDGVVTGTGKGTVKITAACGDVKAECVVTVDVPLTHMDMNLKQVTLLKDGVLDLSVLPNPGADLGEVVWTTSDAAVATVENGRVTAVGVGNCVITAACGDVKATCDVSVYVPLLEIELNSDAAVLQPGETLQLTAMPNEGAVMESVAYTSDNAAVATVDNGLITAVAPGTAVITVTSGDISAKCTVTVKYAVVIPAAERKVYAGETLQMEYAYQFADVTPLGSAVWSVSDARIATVDPATGLLTGVSKGTVQVTVVCTGENGIAYTASADVNVALHATGIELDQISLLIDVNGSEQLHAALVPEGAEGVVEWSSADEQIAVVDANGNVSGVGIGSTVITARYKDFEAQCHVRVEILPQKVDLYTDSMVIQAGKKATIRYEIRPLNATVKGVQWSTSDSAVATVSDDGVITAIKKGWCDITGETENGLQITIPVMVVGKDQAVTSVKLNETEKTLQRTKTLQLKATLSPRGAVDKSVVWASEHPEIATVNQQGLVTAVAPGTTRILVAASNGMIKTCRITVVPLKVSKVTLNKTKATMYSGDQLPLQPALTPADADDLTLTWTSSKKTVATVDENGVVTALKAGTATITCKSASGKTATCKVTVKSVAPVMDVAKRTVGTGDSFAVNVTYKPATENEMQLTWYSDKPSVATVDANGVVTALKAGTAKITCKTQYGVTDYVTVTVKAIMPVMSVSTAKVATGETYTIGVTYSPATQQDMGLTWRSANEAVATVENGVVSAIQPGTAKIYCETKFGKTDYATITVVDPAPVMNITKADVAEGMTCPVTLTYSPAVTQPMQILWQSDNEQVATVDQNGLVTAVSAGSAKILCMTQYGTTDTCTITVKKAVPVMNISKKTMATDTTYGVTVTYSPATDLDMGLMWESSKPSVATVDENGVVTAVKAGTAKITCTTKDGKTDSCTITVKNPVPAMNITKKTIAVNNTYAISVKYSPDTGDAGLTWRSANEAVATVDENGVVTGLKTGTAKIYCETRYGTSDVCTITVATPKPSVPAKKSVVMGGSVALTVKYSPDTSEDMRMEWRSASAAVATVDEFGVVTGVKAGTAKIHCRTQYGDTATCVVTVVTPTPVMERAKMTIYTDETYTMPVTFNPDTPLDVPLKWRTSKPSVATVNAEGMITAISKGTATITCYTEDGKKDSCTITVKATPVQEVHVTNPYGDLAVGGKYTLTAVCYPEHAADKTIVWKSGNVKIAKVDTYTGEITCIAPGTVEIYARAYDRGEIIVPITITVKPVDVQKFELDVSEIRLEADSTRQVNMTFEGDLNGTVPVWASSNEKIATVDQNGLITAVGNGVAAIRCMIGSQVRTVVVSVPRSGDGKYRVLIGGEYTNSKVDGYLNFAVNGLTGVDSAFDLANIYGDRYIIERLNNPSEGKLMETIDEFFADTTNDDVSVLYLMSHGLNKDGQYRWGIAGSKAYVTEAELTRSLEKIKGDVVLVVVSCYAGQYIENFTTSTKKLEGIVSTVNGSRPGNKKISIIASQSGDMTGSYTDFPKEKSYDFFCRLFSKALGWDQENATAYDEMYADANDDGVITLFELASYLENNIQQEIDDHIDQYGEQSVANTAKNKGKQKVEYYLSNPDLVIYARAKERLGKN